MEKILIEIDCGKENCKNCCKKYSDLLHKHFLYCDQFHKYLGDIRAEEIKRLPECLRAEEVKELL
jgi:hypothetical protein